MNKRSPYIKSILLFFPLLLIQTTFIPFVSVNGIVPDLIIILLVFYTINNGQIYGSVLGFIYGFLFDIITGSLLGSTMISKTLAGFIAGYFSSETKKDSYLKSNMFALIVFLSAMIDSIVYALFSAVDFNTTIFKLLFEHALFPAIYTAVLSMLLIFFYPRRRSF